jgi:hypothetical protein
MNDACSHDQCLIGPHPDRVILNLDVDRTIQNDVHLIALLVEMRPRVTEFVFDMPVQNLDTLGSESV